MDKLRVGTIGCGRWGQNYIRVFQEMPQFELAGACDTDPKRIEIVRQRYPHLECFDDPGALLDAPGLEAVAVALPVSGQGPVIRAALERGLHVLAEKPFVTDEAQGRELVELADRRNAVLMIGYTFCYNPALHRLKACIKGPASSIGEMYYLYAIRTALGPFRQDVNAAWDLASHDIAIFAHLLESRPVRANAVGAKLLHGDREDVVFATLTYPGGVIGHIHVSWADPNRVRQVVAVGSRQRVLFDDLDVAERIRIFEKSVYASGKDTDSFGEFILSIRDGDILSPKIDVSEPLKNQCGHFRAAIRDSKPALTDGRFGLDVVTVLGALERSLASGGAPVDISYGT